MKRSYHDIIMAYHKQLRQLRAFHRKAKCPLEKAHLMVEMKILRLTIASIRLGLAMAR